MKIIASDERTFWRFWLGGLAMLALMALKNPALSTPFSPGGILDHQAASSAVAVDAIQHAWASQGMLTLARISMVIDLIFIAVYTRGALAGGLFFRSNENALLRRLGLLIVIAAILFCIADYTETISEFVEVMTFRGNDILALIHSTAQPIKSVTFLVTLTGLLTALVIRRMASRAA